MAHSRIARAVRLTVALQSKVMKEALALEQGVGEAKASKAEARPILAPADPDPAHERRRRIDRVVRRVIEAEEDDEDEVERLSGEAWERLEDEDVYGDVLARPMGEIVARVCEDLGLSPDWTRLAKEAWAVEEARAAHPGSPFAPPAAAEAPNGVPAQPPPRSGPD